MELISKQAELDQLRLEAELLKGLQLEDRNKQIEIQNNKLELRSRNGTLQGPGARDRHQRSGITVTPLRMRKEKRRMRNKMACASRKINRQRNKKAL